MSKLTLNNMDLNTTYYYKNFEIEVYKEYGEDGEYIEYSVFHDKELHTFASAVQVIEFIEGKL